MPAVAESAAYEQIDVSCPVDFSHPLNQGKISWLLCTDTPGWRGGNTLRDLVRGGGRNPNDGTLSGSTLPKWQGGAGRPGGKGSLLLDGSTGYVDCGNFADNLPAFTVAIWFFSASLPNYTPLVEKCANLNNAPGWYILALNSGTQFYSYIQGTGGSTYSGMISTIPASKNALNKWHQAVFSVSGSATGQTAFYYDGVKLGTGTLSGSLTSWSSPNNVVLGKKDGYASSAYFGGNLDDLAIWNRGLTAQEVAANYVISKQGYPGMLRRIAPRDYSFPASAGSSFQPAWAARSNQYLGGGVM